MSGIGRPHTVPKFSRGDANEQVRQGDPDASRLAEAARLDIAWRAEDWPAAAAALGELVGDPPPLGAAIGAGQADLVLNLGVALALADDRAGLDRLALAFGPSMAATPEAGTFALLTRPEAPASVKSTRATFPSRSVSVTPPAES